LGRDRLQGGAGADALSAVDGFADFVDGGDGLDQANADPGLDSVQNVENCSC